MSPREAIGDPFADPEDAWLVQETLQEEGWHLSIESRVAVLSEAEHASGSKWIVRCVHTDTGEEMREVGDSAPEAISRVALRVTWKSGSESQSPSIGPSPS